MNLRRFDLNLLVVLEALLEEKSITAAALRLGLTQPAVSKCLARLRVMLDDPILVRSGKLMVPSPRSQGLQSELREILRKTSELIRPGEFDPSAAEGDVRFFSTDAVTESVITPWVADVSRLAPKLNFEVLGIAPSHFQSISKGEADFAIDVYFDQPDGFYSHEIIRDRFVCVTRKDHPLVRQGLTSHAFQRLRHIHVTSTGGGGGILEQELARISVARDIVLRLPSLAIAAYVASQTDWAVTIPSTRARTSASRYQIDIHALPFEIRQIPLCLVWHARTHTSPLHVWLRSRFSEAVAPRAGMLVHWTEGKNRRVAHPREPG